MTESNSAIQNIKPTMHGAERAYNAQVDDIIDCLKTFEVDGYVARPGVEVNLDANLKNKKNLEALFSKHPNWDPEARAIVFTRTEHRGVDKEGALQVLSQIVRLMSNNTDGFTVDAMPWGRMRRAIMYTDGVALTQEAKESYFDYQRAPDVLKNAAPGTKFTRLVRKLAKEQVDESDGTIFDGTKLTSDESDDTFEKLYAKFADYMSELDIEKVTVLSINYTDFLTMSNGNSWMTCHYINSHGIFHSSDDGSYRGMYKQGCLSYANDDVSFIFYTLDKKATKPYWKVPKINRVCMQYRNGVLVCGKCYPNNEPAKRAAYRQVAETIISECEGWANSWTFSENIERIHGFVAFDVGHANYEDYQFEQQHPSIAINKGHATFDIDDAMEIGHDAYCLCCGEVLDPDEHSSMWCDAHSHIIKCERCGRLFDPDNDDFDSWKQIDGDWYDEDCYFWCEAHNAYEPIDQKHDDPDAKLYRADGYEMDDFCSYAWTSSHVCEDCGRRFFNVKMVKGYCPDCAPKHVKMCPICGKEMEKDMDICPDCKSLEKIAPYISHPPVYRSDDIILVKPDLEGKYREHGGKICMYGMNGTMFGYSGRLVRVKYDHTVGSDGAIRVEPWEVGAGNWSWSDGCFIGRIDDATDDDIGLTIEEFLARRGK